MSGKKPKRSSKNLKINTRIVLTTVLAIAIPLVLVALVSGYNADITAYYEKLGGTLLHL